MGEVPARPYDWRWGDANSIVEEFHISKPEIKRIFLEGWIKGRQVAWKDDDHRAQTIYCFEDVHRYLEEVAHKPTMEYFKRFWTTAEVSVAAQAKGPYAQTI